MSGRFNNTHRMDILMQLIERDGPLCQGHGCKKLLSIPDMRIDHIVPIKAGGDSKDLSKLQILCHSCNIKKGFHEDKMFVCVCDAGQETVMAAKTTDETPVNTTTDGNGNGHAAATHTTSSTDKVLDSACMYVEKPELVGKNVKVRVNDLESDKTRTATMKKADKCKRPWNLWLNEMLDNGCAYTYDEYAHAGANRFDCSEATIKRYMDDRLDAPDCNPIEGDLTFRLGPGGKLCVTWKDKERFYFK